VKAITLTQPWASLVAIGAKRIETRSWSTKYRGPLAIHAAKKFPQEAWDICEEYPFFDALYAGGFGGVRKDEFEDNEAFLYQQMLPLGCAIATCELVICMPIPKFMTNFFIPHEGIGTFTLPPGEPELSFGDYTPGRFAWILANIKPLPDPVEAKGMLGLWEWER
jgi:activating signal cointegrator 1